jgi:hypothetical protein
MVREARRGRVIATLLVDFFEDVLQSDSETIGGGSMKRTVAIVIVALAAVGFAQAAELTTNPNPANPPSGGPYFPDAPNITQSVDPVTITELNGIACSGGGISADNHFIRRFFLNADHGISVQYNVTSVDFGIESCNVYVGTTAPITMYTYAIANGAPLTFANMGTPLDSTTRDFPDGTALVVENWVVGGSIVDPVATDLVIDMFYPDTEDAYGIWPGTNAAGETQPGYLASVACSLPEPATLDSIGFPDVDLVATVNGDEQVVPTPTPPPPSGALNPVPALGTYGIVAMVLLIVGVAVLLMWRRN